jgi:hypothetical protein
MARHHLAAALAALCLPAIAVPVAASPPGPPPASPLAPPSGAIDPTPAAEAPAPPAEPAPAPAPPPIEAAIEAAPVAMPEPGPACGIRVVRAPADLRDQVEGQLQADGAACSGALDVWLVPASDGIYVQARDRGGRLRERMVPDAVIAATLLASWVEIDAAAPVWAPPPTEATPPSAAAPVAPPRATAAVARPGLVASAPRRRSRIPGFAVSAMAVETGSDLSGGGIRVGVDLLRFGRFELGVAAQASSLDGGNMMFRDPDYTNRHTLEYERDTGDVMATLRATFRVGPLRLHPQVALGAGYAEHLVFIFYDRIYSYEAAVTSVGARAEAALGASLGFGRWSVEALAGTGAATYTGKSEENGDHPPVWLDGINSAMIGVRFTP